MGAEGSKPGVTNIDDIPDEKLQAAIAATMDLVANESDPPAEPTPKAVIEKLKETMASMGIQGDINTKKALIEKTVNDILAD